MKLLTVKLIVVELIQSLKVITDIKNKHNDWVVEPHYSFGQNSIGKHILNIEVEVIRTINTQRGIIKVMTSFELELGSKEFIPSTDAEFIEYANFQQMAIAHARALFLRETKGTKFDGSIIPMDSMGHAVAKVKLSFNTLGSEN